MEPLPTRDHLLRQVVIRAATAPVSLFLGTTGLLLIASPVAWPLGAAALAGEVGWLWYRIRDPHHAQVSSEEMLRTRWRDLITRLEDVGSSLDRGTAATLTAIVEVQERLQGMCGPEQMLMPSTRVEMTSLMERCVSLAEKRRQLQGYLSTVRTGEVQRQASQIQAKVEKASDAVTKELYQQALEQKRQELENYVRLEEAVARIDGQLAAVQCTFDNMLSKMVRIHSVDSPSAQAQADPVSLELHQLTRGVAALEASLQETLTVGSRG